MMIPATERVTVSDATIEPEAAAPPSKSQRKREAEALQDLGARLVALPETQFRRMALPEELREAVAQCRRIRENSALRRQRQFIGKLMRQIDPAPIQAQLDAFRGASARETAKLHQAERWRDRLIAGNDALTGFLDEHPHADATHLRQLIRAAREEAARAKPPRAARELFRTIRALLDEESGVAA